MAKALRVLIINESVYDCMLLVKELRRCGLEPRYGRVDTPEALAVALGREPWDVVIADYGMGPFSGLEAIKIVGERQPDLPFIFLSDVTGEEAAVTALRAGARDYLPKERLERLVPAIERALGERDAQRTRQSPDQGPTRSELHGPTPAETVTTSAPISSGAPLASPSEPLPKFIGRYRVVDKIGEGGMGAVFKAHDPKLDRLVAVKIPRFDSIKCDSAMLVQRFLREARAAARIRNPNVCPIYDADEMDGVPFVVMAYVEGQSLADRLRAIQQYPDIAEAARLVRDAAHGLKAVHAHGIVHRDLKPANILLDRDGQPLLTDFGLARPENDAQPLTLQGAVMGTPAYMAPEQASGELDRIGPWTDIYSLSVVLYCMLTGSPPFQGSALNILMKVLNESPPAPSKLRPGLDGALEAVILKGMARRPEERYQTAQELTEALNKWLAA